MLVIRQWTGREATVLRTSMRSSVRRFADVLGVSPRTVSDWSRFGSTIIPRPDTQAILDTELSRCTGEERERFELALRDGQVRDAPPHNAPGAEPLDYEQWSDDLNRAAIAVGRQSFTLAADLVDRWRLRAAAHARLDARGLCLAARGLVLLGDVRRDQGVLAGPGSARHAYRDGLEIYRELAIPRRAAQVDLSLAVVSEMSGSLSASVRAYRELSGDLRLDPRDRARASLWVGTALSKLGQNETAVRVMTGAADQFEMYDEPEDWSIAQQKIALAHRGAGRIDPALRLIEVARTSRVDATPMQQVRLDTAHAHILTSDPATRDSGLAMLERSSALALQYGLSHQRRAIDAIRAAAR